MSDGLFRLAMLMDIHPAILEEDLDMSGLTLVDFANLRLPLMSPSKVGRILRGEPEPKNSEEFEECFRKQLRKV